MVTLSDSTDDYQTPPEIDMYSQNSSNDGQVAAVAGVDRDGEGLDSGVNIGGLGKSDVRFCDYKDDGLSLAVDDDTEKIEIEELIVEMVGTEEIDSSDEVGDQVFDLMPERQKGDTGLNLGKRKLPSTINTIGGEEDEYCKRRRFVAMVDRVSKMLAWEGKVEENDEEFDFLETAKMRGMRFPRPRWLPGDGLDE